MTSVPLNVKAASKNPTDDFSDVISEIKGVDRSETGNYNLVTDNGLPGMEPFENDLQDVSENILELPENLLLTQTFNFLFSKLKIEVSYGIKLGTKLTVLVNSWCLEAEYGDGIVPDWSASINGNYGNYICFNQVQHLELIWDSEVLKYIESVIGDQL